MGLLRPVLVLQQRKVPSSIFPNQEIPILGNKILCSERKGVTHGERRSSEDRLEVPRQEATEGHKESQDHAEAVVSERATMRSSEPGCRQDDLRPGSFLSVVRSHHRLSA